MYIIITIVCWFGVDISTGAISNAILPVFYWSDHSSRVSGIYVYSSVECFTAYVHDWRKWHIIVDQLYTLVYFPNNTGTVDGKHITTIQACNSGSEYFN